MGASSCCWSWKRHPSILDFIGEPGQFLDQRNRVGAKTGNNRALFRTAVSCQCAVPRAHVILEAGEISRSRYVRIASQPCGQEGIILTSVLASRCAMQQRGRS